jgi:(4S)-4-hydroxy-5-phosphonooxypentane-2,3-dione isomerase
MAAPTCAVCVVFNIFPQHFDKFYAAVLQQAKNSRERETWCHQFDVSTMPDRPHSVLLYETYDDRDAFAKHRLTEHFAEFTKAIEGCVESKEVGIWDIQS